MDGDNAPAGTPGLERPLEREEEEVATEEDEGAPADEEGGRAAEDFAFAFALAGGATEEFRLEGMIEDPMAGGERWDVIG